MDDRCTEAKLFPDSLPRQTTDTIALQKERERECMLWARGTGKARDDSSTPLKGCLAKTPNNITGGITPEPQLRFNFHGKRFET